MSDPTDIEVEHRKALEFLLLIRAGLFDHHLDVILTATTDRMRDPAYTRPAAPAAPTDPDDWPHSGLFAPHDG